MNYFDEVYRAKKLGKLNQALKLLVNDQTNGLRSPFKAFANHSWYIVGDVFFLKKDYKKAIKAFKKALRTEAEDYQALWAVANCYSYLKKPVFAERYLRKAIQLAPKEKRESLRYDLGNALFDQQNYEGAIHFYRSISKRDHVLSKMAKKNIAVAGKQLA